MASHAAVAVRPAAAWLVMQYKKHFIMELDKATKGTFDLTIYLQWILLLYLISVNCCYICLKRHGFKMSRDQF